MSDHDPVNSPSHYQIMPGVEVYDVRMGLLAKMHGVAPGAADDWSRAWEYLTRMWGKNGLEDAKKARWYLDKLIGKLEQRPVTCPDCGAPEGELHYVLCPRLPVPEAHAEAVEAAFAEQAQFDEARADIIGQNGNDGEHYEQPVQPQVLLVDELNVPADVDVNDWRTWQEGDLLECIKDFGEGGETLLIRVGDIVEMDTVEPPDYEYNLPFQVKHANFHGWPDLQDYSDDALDGATIQYFRFHSRPAKTDE